MDNQHTGEATAHPAGFIERERTIERLDRLATLLDTAYRVPGTNVRFGLDALIGLFPGVGDVASAALSAYLIYQARRLGGRRGVAAGRRRGRRVLARQRPQHAHPACALWRAGSPVAPRRLAATGRTRRVPGPDGQAF